MLPLFMPVFCRFITMDLIPLLFTEFISVKFFFNVTMASQSNANTVVELLMLSLGGYNLHILLLLLLFRAKGTVYQRTQVSITLFDRFMV